MGLLELGYTIYSSCTLACRKIALDNESVGVIPRKMVAAREKYMTHFCNTSFALSKKYFEDEEWRLLALVVTVVLLRSLLKTIICFPPPLTYVLNTSWVIGFRS